MRRLVFLLALVAVIGGLSLFLSWGFQGEVVRVNLALKEPGKTFLYSQETTAAVAQQLAEGQSPMVLPVHEILTDGDELYVQPVNMQALVQLMAGEVQYHEYAEPSYDGYLSAAPQRAFRLETHTQATETIGEQLIAYTITLTNSTGKEKVIRFTLSPTTYDPQALENCQVEKFKVTSQPAPGEIVTSIRPFVVVPVQEIADFFGVSGVRWERSTGLLYVSL
ncbi:MAG: hypothetical protein AAFQ98_20175 [Bacteroidota bacterium]